MRTRIERVVEDAGMKVMSAIEGRRFLTRKEVAEWRDLEIDEQVRRNREKADELVVKWDRLVKRPIGRPAKHLFVFMHIPKAAGSTFDNVIPKNYDINGVVHINPPLFYQNPAALMKDGRLPRAFMGHFKFNQFFYQLPTEPFIHVTILREPIGRLVSYYNFLLAAKKHGRHKKAESVTFAEFLEAKSNHECHNGQALRITGFLNRRFVRRPLPADEAFELTKQALLERFTFFGLTERYSEFMLTCRKLLGWNDLYYAKRKITRDTPKRISRKDLSDEVINRARELNEVDVRLYEWAAGVVEERCRELGITPEMAEEFERRNTEYEELTHRPFFDGKR